MTMATDDTPVDINSVDSSNLVNLPPDYSVTARMDMLQNQLNQVLLMMQHNNEASTSSSHNFMAGLSISRQCNGNSKQWNSAESCSYSAELQTQSPQDEDITQ